MSVRCEGEGEGGHSGHGSYTLRSQVARRSVAQCLQWLHSWTYSGLLLSITYCCRGHPSFPGRPTMHKQGPSAACPYLYWMLARHCHSTQPLCLSLTQGKLRCRGWRDIVAGFSPAAEAETAGSHGAPQEAPCVGPWHGLCSAWMKSTWQRAARGRTLQACKALSQVTCLLTLESSLRIWPNTLDSQVWRPTGLAAAAAVQGAQAAMIRTAT